MRYRLRTLLLTITLLTLVCSFLWWLNYRRNTTTVTLNDRDVESITAEVFKDDMVMVGAPQTQIPAEYIPLLLDTLRPIVTDQDRERLWDELPPLGKLTIHKRDHTRVEIAFRMCGQNRLHFEYNGVRCRRDGPYEPVVDMELDNGVRMGYGDESLMLAQAITEISREVEHGIKSPLLAEIFRDSIGPRGSFPPSNRNNDHPALSLPAWRTCFAAERRPVWQVVDDARYDRVCQARREATLEHFCGNPQEPFLLPRRCIQ